MLQHFHQLYKLINAETSSAVPPLRALSSMLHAAFKLPGELPVRMLFKAPRDTSDDSDQATARAASPSQPQMTPQHAEPPRHGATTPTGGQSPPTAATPAVTPATAPPAPMDTTSPPAAAASPAAPPSQFASAQGGVQAHPMSEAEARWRRGGAFNIVLLQLMWHDLVATPDARAGTVLTMRLGECGFQCPAAVEAMLNELHGGRPSLVSCWAAAVLVPRVLRGAPPCVCVCV